MLLVSKLCPIPIKLEGDPLLSIAAANLIGLVVFLRQLLLLNV